MIISPRHDRLAMVTADGVVIKERKTLVVTVNFCHYAG
jgi:hypothetical protein